MGRLARKKTLYAEKGLTHPFLAGGDFLSLSLRSPSGLHPPSPFLGEGDAALPPPPTASAAFLSFAVTKAPRESVVEAPTRLVEGGIAVAIAGGGGERAGEVGVM